MTKGLPIKDSDGEANVVMDYDSEANEIQLLNGSWDSAEKWEVDMETVQAIIEKYREN